MKPLVSSPIPADVAVIRETSDFVTAGANHRIVALSNLSGYPQAYHAVARLKQKLNLSSLYELYKSLALIRDLATIAADVLDATPMSKIGNMSLNRSELSAFVKNSNYKIGASSLTEDQIDLIVFLIVSSEANDASWNLDIAPGSDNIIIAFSSLYRRLMDDAKSGSYSNGAVYVPGGDVVKYGDVYTVTQLKTPEEQKAAIASIGSVFSIAHLRCLDHLFMLWMDKDIWKKFITPRSTNDAGENIERVKGLRLLASYCQSVLMLPSIFSIELFRNTYTKLEGWLGTLPAIPEHADKQYAAVVTKYDVFGASALAHDVLNRVDGNHPNTDAPIKGFLKETISAFNMDGILAKADAAKTALSGLQSFGDMKELISAEYNYLTLSFPLTDYNLFADFSNAVISNAIVANKITEAAAAVSPGVSRYYADVTTEDLKRLSLSIPFAIFPKIPSVYHVAQAGSASCERGTVLMTRNVVQDSVLYRRYLRRELLYGFFTDRHIAKHSSDPTLPSFMEGWQAPFGINSDTREKLVKILGREWKSPIPIALSTNDRTITSSVLSVEKEQVRRFMEDLSGEQFAYIERTIRAPYIRKMWATFLSSCACLYIVDVPKDKFDLAKVTDWNVYLERGYGKPYGFADYDALAADQGTRKPEEFIQICDGVYICFHTRIPTPQLDLKLDEDFYLKHPYYYFPANSTRLKVEEWTLGDGLWNFALIPIAMKASLPSVVLDKRYAYLNSRLYMEDNLMSTPSPLNLSEYGTSFPITTRKWPWDRFHLNTEYVTFGNYSGSASSFDKVNTNDTTALIEKMESEIAKVEETANKAKPSGKVNVDVVKIDKVGSKSNQRRKDKKKAEKTEIGKEIETDMDKTKGEDDAD